MAKPMVVRLAVADLDLIIKCLSEILGNPGLTNRNRRRLGLALQNVTKAKKRSNSRNVCLEEADVIHLLHCFAEIRDWSAEIWRRYFEL